MALVEAVLTYRTSAIGGEGSVVVAKTEDPRALRFLRDCLLEQADREFHMWERVDPGVAAVRAGELDRLTTLLGFLLPDEDLGPALHPIAGGRNGDSRDDAD